MAYEKQTWECGDVVTAEKLNHMEDGIAEASGGGTVPSVTSADNGKVLGVENGEYALTEEWKNGLALTDDVIVFDQSLLPAFMLVGTSTPMAVIPLSTEIKDGDTFDVYLSGVTVNHETTNTTAKVSYNTKSIINQNMEVGTKNYMWATNVETMAVGLSGNPVGIMKNTQENREKVFGSKLNDMDSVYRNTLINAPTLAFVATPRDSNTVEFTITIFKK